MLSFLKAAATLCLVLCASVSAQEADRVDTEGQQYLAEIELHTAEELHRVLVRADQLLLEGPLPLRSPVPVTFILHGPEVRILLRQNYLNNKATVDLAARLSALGVVDIKACETWMGGASVVAEDLQPFVDTVSYGPSEVSRLVKEQNYLYF
jgi:intracellular sulfur oxidation DsrE/DsrF family protein